MKIKRPFSTVKGFERDSFLEIQINQKDIFKVAKQDKIPPPPKKKKKDNNSMVALFENIPAKPTVGVQDQTAHFMLSGINLKCYKRQIQVMTGSLGG